jgi:hypothetical protein
LIPTVRQVSWPDWRRNPLSPKHYEVLKSRAKKMILNCGRAFGKDHILFLRGLMLALILFAQRRAMGSNWIRYGPMVVMYVYAPQTDNFEGLWKRFKEMLPQIPGKAADGQDNVQIYDKKGDEAVELFGKNGIYIRFFSVLQPNAGRGNGCDILCGTEVGYGKETTLTEVLLRLVRRANYAGWVMLNCTPIEPNHWWDKAVKAARHPKKYPDSLWSHYELHEGTFVDNPTSDDEDWEEFMQSMRANVFTGRREWLGWVDQPRIADSVMNAGGENRAWKKDLIDACLVAIPVEKRGPFYAGTDLAWSGKDLLATVIVDDSTGMIAHIETHPKMDDESIVRHFEKIEREWKPIKHTYDANGPLAKNVQGRLRGIGLNPVTTTTRHSGDDTKAEQVKVLTTYLVERAIHIPHPQVYPGLSDEMRKALYLLLKELYEYLRLEVVRDVVDKGRIDKRVYITYSKPPEPGASDDILDALNLCVLPRAVTVEAAAATAIHDYEVWGD